MFKKDGSTTAGNSSQVLFCGIHKQHLYDTLLSLGIVTQDITLETLLCFVYQQAPRHTRSQQYINPLSTAHCLQCHFVLVSVRLVPHALV